jgi:hypothetical protein
MRPVKVKECGCLCGGVVGGGGVCTHEDSKAIGSKREVAQSSGIWD